MSSRDTLILSALRSEPTWLASVLAKLDGHADASSCWLWKGALDKGYGKVRIPRSAERSEVVPVHRVVWLALVGPIPDGLVLDHDGPTGCSNRACANPAHLSPVPNRNNVAVTGKSFAARNAAKTHCPAGHPLTAGNLTAAGQGWGFRQCATCARERDAARAQAIQSARRALGLDHRTYVARYGKSRAAAEAILQEVGNG